MGDCRLIFHVHASFCPQDGGSHDESDSIVLTQTFSADTTIREVMDQTLLPEASKSSITIGSNSSSSIRTLLLRGKAKFWDSTVHPSRDITDWPLDSFAAVKGSKSKTLYDAGWFPSGTFHVLPSGVKPQLGSIGKYEDIQYNKQQSKPAPSSSSRSSRLQGIKAKPSQILQAARSKPKSQAEQQEELNRAAQAKASRRERLEQEQQKEDNRKRRLEKSLQKLEANKSNNTNIGKNKNVSAQVRRMLIKSRATGRDNLDESDRVYMQINMVQRDYKTNQLKPEIQEFKFFSKQDTVGRVLETFELPANHQAELLVPSPDQSSGGSVHDGGSTPLATYRKLPNLLRFYEAIENKLLPDSESAVLTLRIFDPSKEKHTPLDPPAQVDPPARARNCQSLDAGHNLQPYTPTFVDPPSGAEMARRNSSHDRQSTTRTDPLDDDNDAPNLQSTLSADSSIATFKSMEPSGSKADDDEPDSLGLELSPNAPLAKNPLLLQVIADSIRKGKGRSRKATAAARKVKQMQIKSKAVGDEKRVKVANRFYFEVVFVSTEETKSHEYFLQSVKPHFMNGGDSVNRLVRDYYSNERKNKMEPGQGWDYLTLPMEAEESVLTATPTELSSIALQRVLDPSQSFAALQQSNMLQPFDKLILIALG
eukprot:CAMPEP_0168720548 /NCGR_PEP_ID=MMETSP0724-20121128/1618_1 /TAXON_ID=265536 /ORGANISM="Amphiprora sp., Strain CCMP467" /LENGTH=650 /DNA_ID=CAMNT_0008767151 /DNA_START=12 /DNA_END=1964 /DNA_ORIENTATION=+